MDPILQWSILPTLKSSSFRILSRSLRRPNCLLIFSNIKNNIKLRRMSSSLILMITHKRWWSALKCKTFRCSLSKIRWCLHQWLIWLPCIPAAARSMILYPTFRLTATQTLLTRTKKQPMTKVAGEFILNLSEKMPCLSDRSRLSSSKLKNLTIFVICIKGKVKTIHSEFHIPRSKKFTIKQVISNPADNN